MKSTQWYFQIIFHGFKKFGEWRIIFDIWRFHNLQIITRFPNHQFTTTIGFSLVRFEFAILRDNFEVIKQFFYRIDGWRKNYKLLRGHSQTTWTEWGEGGVLKMFTLLYNPYLVKWFTRGEGGIKKSRNLVHVVCECPQRQAKF